MTLQKQTGHVAQARGLLISRFHKSSRLHGVLDAFTSRVQDLEDALFTLLTLKDPDALSGQALEQLGRLVGQPREGRTDTVYRTWVKARIRANRSHGRTVDVIDVARVLFAASISLRLEPLYPAAYALHADDPIDVDGEQIARILRQTKAAGVNGQFAWHLVSEPFGQTSPDIFRLSADSSLETDSAHGFDAGILGSVSRGVGAPSPAVQVDLSAAVYTRTGPAYHQDVVSPPLREVPADTPPIEHSAGWPRPMLQLQGQRDNYLEDFDSWFTAGEATITAGIDDPKGGTGAFRIESLGDIASGNWIQNNPVDDPFASEAALAPSFWARPISPSFGTLGVRDQHGSSRGLWHVDVSMLDATAWQRITEDHPAVTVVEPWIADPDGGSDALFFTPSGGPFDIDLFWPQIEPRYATASIEPQTTRSPQSHVIPSADVPQALRSGKFSFWIAPAFSSTDADDESGVYRLLDYGTGAIELHGESFPTGLRVIDGSGAEVVDQGLSWARRAPMRVTLDTTGKITVEGALLGDGSTVFAPFTFDESGDVAIGMSLANDLYFDGAMSHPLEE